MRKSIIGIVSLILSALFVLTGCTGTTPLTFTHDFNGAADYTNNLNPTYVETLTYSISYDEDYSGLVKDKAFEGVTLPTYSGSYKTILEGDISFLTTSDWNYQTDINFSSDIHRLTTTYELSVTLGDKTYLDQIVTESVFFASNHSFAPVYENSKYKMTFFSLANNNTELIATRQMYEHTTTYNTSSYTISTKTYKMEETDNVDLKTADTSAFTTLKTTTNTYNYTCQHLIDNSHFLFALRNFTVEKEKSSRIAVVSPSYGQYKDMLVQNKDEYEQTIPSLSYNGTLLENEKVSVKRLSYSLNSMQNSGTPHQILVQKSKSANIPFKAIMTEYAQPLVETSSFSRFGAIVCKLQSIEITE